MHTIYLVGTDHRYQRGSAFGVSSATFSEFREDLKRLISQHAIRGIAEEMSIDGLGLHRSAGGSLGFHLAGELALLHAYCDPNRETRRERGITSIEERERYWLDQLESFTGFPCLFILGAEHIKTFSALLEQSGFRPIVSIHDWEPTSHAEA